MQGKLGEAGVALGGHGCLGRSWDAKGVPGVAWERLGRQGRGTGRLEETEVV